jgi:hypothetical protein
MVFVIDSFGAVPSAAVGAVRLSDQHDDMYQLVAMVSEGRESNVELGYVLRTQGPNGQYPSDVAEKGVIPRTAPALLIQTRIPEPPSQGKSLKSFEMSYWAKTVRRTDLRRASQPELSARSANGNPWCNQMSPVDLEEVDFNYHYDGDRYVTEGVRYRDSWSFGASILWYELPALLLVSGRGIEASDLWFEPVNSEAILELQRLPRLMLG